jgi:hypothetical protein
MKRGNSRNCQRNDCQGNKLQTPLFIPLTIIPLTIFPEMRDLDVLQRKPRKLSHVGFLALLRGHSVGANPGSQIRVVLARRGGI